MRGIVVSANYHSGNLIDLWIRCEDGSKVKVTVNDFKPYFYVPSDDGFHVGVDGKRLKRIEVNNPKYVEKLRSKYDMHYEANIPFVQRFLIDTKVYTGVEITGIEHDELTENVTSFESIRPCEVKVDPLVAYLDIEVANPGELITNQYINRAPHEVICYTLYCRGKYFTGVYREDLDDSYEWRGNWCIFHCSSEKTMLSHFVELLRKINCDVIVGWNLDYFDIPYLRSRLSKLDILYDFDFFDTFDLMVAYKDIFKNKESYALKSVAVEEGLIDEEEKEVFNFDWWMNDLDKLLYYNKRDVYLTYQIDKKHKLFSQYRSKKEISGLYTYRQVYEQKPAIDVVCLRVAKEKGIVLPSYPIQTRGLNLKGGFVLHPKPGLYRNVAVFDFSRYYPSIILSFNLDTPILFAYYRENEKFELEKFLKFASEYVKTGGKTIIIDVVKRFLKLRDEIDAQLEKSEPGTEEYEELQCKKQAVKSLVNAVYGVCAYEGFRLYAPEIAAATTALGREGISAIIAKSKEMGYEVRYSDTDSVFVQCPLEKANELSSILTEYVNNYFYKKYGVRTDVKLKFEKYFSSVFFKGVKKRYSYRCIYEGKPCDYIGYKGFEVVRSDSSKFVKNLMTEMFNIIHGEDYRKLETWLPKKVEEFRRCPLSEIAIPKGINKRFEDYRPVPAHIRGALYANSYLGDRITPGAKVFMLYVNDIKGKPKTDVIAVSDPKMLDEISDIISVDWNRMIELSIVRKVEDFFRILGVPMRLYEKQMTLW